MRAILKNLSDGERVLLEELEAIIQRTGIYSSEMCLKGTFT